MVHARTLEFYRQLGIDSQVVDDGLRFAAINLWVRGRQAGRVAFGDIGAGLSPFPYMIIYAQDEHERMLIAQLAEAGVQVQRSTTLIAFEERGDLVSATLRRADGSEDTCSCSYLAGCDGATRAQLVILNQLGRSIGRGELL